MPLDDFRSVFMPYVVSRQPDGRYLVLNRENLPLGQWRADQQVAVESVELKNMSPKIAAAVSFKGDPNLANIYLYGDENVPTSSVTAMKAYLGRLSRLMKLKVSPAGAAAPSRRPR